MELEFHQLDLRHEGLRVHRPEKESRLVGSLSEVGQQVPIVVVAAAQAGRYLVIDGFKRCRALRRLRQDTVLATAWDLSEAEALLLLHAQRADFRRRHSWGSFQQQPSTDMPVHFLPTVVIECQKHPQTKRNRRNLLPHFHLDHTRGFCFRKHQQRERNQRIPRNCYHRNHRICCLYRSG